MICVSPDKAILDLPQVEGKCFTVWVNDSGSGDIGVSLRYSSGTTDNCVVKGKNVISGEAAVNRSFSVRTADITDSAKRAKAVLGALAEMLKQIEGK